MAQKINAELRTERQYQRPGTRAGHGRHRQADRSTPPSPGWPAGRGGTYRRRRLSGRTRRLPGGRGLRVVPGGPAGGGRADCSASWPARAVLEVGCGAAQCARWLVTQGAMAVGDRPVRWHARPRCDGRTTWCLRSTVPLVQASADAVAVRGLAVSTRRPARLSVPCLLWPTPAPCCARWRGVLRPGGLRGCSRSLTRCSWISPDDPGRRTDRGRSPYFDRTVSGGVARRGPGHLRASTTGHGRVSFVRQIVAARAWRLTDLIEPEWPAGPRQESGDSGARCAARLFPGTAIFCCTRV